MTAQSPGDRSWLRIATWNVHSCLRGLSEVAALIASLDLDLIALQEVDRAIARSGHVDQAAELARRAGFAYFHHFKAVSWGSGDYGLALLSKHPLSGLRAGLLPSADLEQRIHASAVVQLPEGELEMHVAHLSHLPTRARLRLDQAQVLVNRIGGRPRPALLAGDFNDGPRSQAHQLLARSFVDVFDKVGTGAAGTLPFGPFTFRLDYLYATADLALDSAKVVPTNASDHHLLLAQLRLPAAPQLSLLAS